MTVDSFEDAVAECHAKGYRVHNLFERDVHRGLWQANLFAPGEKTYSQFGIAATPHGAIMEALKGAPDLTPATPASLFD